MNSRKLKINETEINSVLSFPTIPMPFTLNVDSIVRLLCFNSSIRRSASTLIHAKLYFSDTTLAFSHQKTLPWQLNPKMHQLHSHTRTCFLVGPGNIDSNPATNAFSLMICFASAFRLLSSDGKREARQKAKHLWEVQKVENDWWYSFSPFRSVYDCCWDFLVFPSCVFWPRKQSFESERFTLTPLRRKSRKFSMSRFMSSLVNEISRQNFFRRFTSKLSGFPLNSSKSLRIMKKREPGSAIKSFSFLFSRFSPSPIRKKLMSMTRRDMKLHTTTASKAALTPTQGWQAVRFLLIFSLAFFPPSRQYFLVLLQIFPLLVSVLSERMLCWRVWVKNKEKLCAGLLLRLCGGKKTRRRETWREWVKRKGGEGWNGRENDSGRIEREWIKENESLQVLQLDP